MTPKEFKFFVGTLEHATMEAYKEGHNHASQGKSLNLNQFKMNRASQLMLKTALETFVKTA